MAALVGEQLPTKVNRYSPIGETRGCWAARLEQQATQLFQNEGGGAQLTWTSCEGLKGRIRRSFMTNSEIEKSGMQQVNDFLRFSGQSLPKEEKKTRV